MPLILPVNFTAGLAEADELNQNFNAIKTYLDELEASGGLGIDEDALNDAIAEYNTDVVNPAIGSLGNRVTVLEGLAASEFTIDRTLITAGTNTGIAHNFTLRPTPRTLLLGDGIAPTATRFLNSIILGDGAAPKLVTTGTAYGGSNEPGGRNVIIGVDSCGNLTTGFWNVVIGEKALNNGTECKAMVIIGKSAFQNNADSVDCNVIGEATGAGVITGNGHNLFGTNIAILSGIPPYMDYWYDMGQFGSWPKDPVTRFPINGDSDYPDMTPGEAVTPNTLRKAVPPGKTYKALYQSNATRTVGGTIDATELTNWTYRGSEHPTPRHQPSTAYTVGTLVKVPDPTAAYLGRMILLTCTVDHTSSATFTTAEMAANWKFEGQLDPVEPVTQITGMGNGAHFSINGNNNIAIGPGALKGSEVNTKIRGATGSSLKLHPCSSPEDDWYITNLSSPNPRRICIMSGTGAYATYGASISQPAWVPGFAYTPGDIFRAPFYEVYSGAINARVGFEALYRVPAGFTGNSSGTFNATEAARYTLIGKYSGSGASQIFIQLNDIIGYDADTQTITLARPWDTIPSTTDSTYQITINPYSFRYRNKDSSYRSSNTTAIGDSAAENAEEVIESTVVGRNVASNLRKARWFMAFGNSAGQLKVDGSLCEDGVDNCVVLGYTARVSGPNQVQLGSSSQTVYSQSAIVIRSDARDKADIAPADERYARLFDQLKFKQFRLNPRDAYVDMVETGEYKTEAYLDPETNVVKTRSVPILERKVYDPAIHDFSGNRIHLGLIAQDIPDDLEAVGLDTQQFAGYKDASYDGTGVDVKSLQYDQIHMLTALRLKQLIQEFEDYKREHP
jgi:hypothetical protein